MKYNVKLGNFFEKYEKIGGTIDINNVYKIPSMNSYDVIDGGDWKTNILSKMEKFYGVEKERGKWQKKNINGFEESLLVDLGLECKNFENIHFWPFYILHKLKK